MGDAWAPIRPLPPIFFVDVDFFFLLVALVSVHGFCFIFLCEGDWKDGDVHILIFYFFAAAMWVVS